MPAIDQYVWDPTLQSGTGLPGTPSDVQAGAVGILRTRTPQEINSLMDLYDQPVAGGGFTGGSYGADSPMSDPNNWRLTRGDLESPLGYMGAAHGPFVEKNWQGSDKGGYFTLDQLYGVGRGGSVPQLFSRDASMPSTNNWRLTLPFGGGPGAILRNGKVIYPGSPETGHGAPRGADTGPGGPAEGASPIGSWSNPGSGAWYGVPNTWRGMSGWPGASLQNWNYDRWPVGNV